MGRIAFFTSEAFRALRRSAAPSIAAIVTIVVTTLLLGVIVPVLKASEDKASDVRDQIGLNVYLYDDATKAEIAALKTKLAALDHVEAVDFISKNEAVGILEGRVKGDLKDSIGELNSNPLPASFAIDIIYLARARAAERRAAILNGARTAPYSGGLRRRPGRTHDPAKARTAWMGPMSAMSRGDRA